jgi:hypothetical protein
MPTLVDARAGISDPARPPRARGGGSTSMPQLCKTGFVWVPRQLGFVRARGSGAHGPAAPLGSFERSELGSLGRGAVWICGLPGAVRAHGFPLLRVPGSFGRGKTRVSFGFHGRLGFGRGGLGFRMRCEGSGAPVRSDPQPHATAPALTMAPCSPRLFTGKADMPPREASSVADYGNIFNPDSQERTLDRRRRDATAEGRAAGGLRIAQSRSGQGLTAELSTLGVKYARAAM